MPTLSLGDRAKILGALKMSRKKFIAESEIAQLEAGSKDSWKRIESQIRITHSSVDRFVQAILEQ